MPISTIPNLPTRVPETEQILKSPQARARNRWLSTTMVNMTGRYLNSSSPNDGNTQLINQPASSSACFINYKLFYILLGSLVLAILFREQIFSTHIFENVGILDLVDISSSKPWVFVTASSPYALEKGCRDFKGIFLEGFIPTPSILLKLLQERERLQESTIICSPPPFNFRQFFRDPVSNNFQTVFYVENGLSAAFDDGFSNWTRAYGPNKDIEDLIDETCLQRRIKTRRKINCAINEIPVLRAGSFWARWNLEARALYLRILEVPNENVNAKERLEEMAHEAFLRQLVTHHLNEPSLYPSAVSPIPKHRLIDAGHCVIVSKNEDPNYNGPKATCLPTFLIIGAQKSGTDELAVWLNRNQYNRRMDGGVEVHFFDCVGRGLGSGRFSCDRKRSFLMKDHHSESREILTGNDTVKLKTDFSWNLVNKASPYLDDVWKNYLRLGHLNSKNFYRVTGRTLIYDKSPSYIDMADPRDVARLIPRGKFIILTRDPVPRLLSAYFQFCDNPELNHDDSPCTIEEFERLVLDLSKGRLDLVTEDKTLPRRLNFMRAAKHGEYINFIQEWTKYFWVDTDMLDKQFLIVDQHHFRFIPLAVLYAVESFTGNRGGFRHYPYQPKQKNGFWVLGDYSKATHPTHTKNMSPETEKLLREYYRPSILGLKRMIMDPTGPVTFGCGALDSFPPEYVSANPVFFDGKDRFQLPPWIKNFE